MNVESRPFRKPFSQDLYRKYDNPAKNALINLLLSEGHEILDLNESFYADIISEKDGIQYYSEGEVKTGWRGAWPSNWKEIRIPERKKKLIQKHGHLTFYIFSGTLEECWKIDSSLLTDDILREAIGRNIYKGELFYHIPYQDAELIDLKSLAA